MQGRRCRYVAPTAEYAPVLHTIIPSSPRRSSYTVGLIFMFFFHEPTLQHVTAAAEQCNDHVASQCKTEQSPYF